MRILTIGASPYLLTNLGKLHSDVIKYFKKAGHFVGSAVWHLDTTWFMGDEQNQFFYENNDNKSELFPFVNMVEQSATMIYEIMKKFQPDIVISMGDYEEHTCISPVRTLYPQLFKWIGIFALDALPVNQNEKEIIEGVDYAIATTKFGQKELARFIGEDSKYLPYGPNKKIFKDLQISKNENILKIINCSKNSQSANLGCFLQACSMYKNEDISTYLHTNIYDVGDYDIHLLLDRWGIEEDILLPERYVGLNDGYEEAEMNDIYNDCDVVVDVSVKSSIGISILEGMTSGCIPVCTDVGAIGEVVHQLPEDCKFFVPSYEFLGKKEESYFIASHRGLSDKITELYNIKIDDIDRFNYIRKKCIEIASKYNNENFVLGLEKIVEEAAENNSKITIEDFV